MKSFLGIIFGAALLISASLSAEAQVERTLSIIKPDAVAAHHVGAIIGQFEEQGLDVVGARMMRLSQRDAEAFYGVHRDRPFYPALVQYITSGPVLVMVLEGPDAVKANRAIMGATNPKEAKQGTIRSRFGTDIQQNAVHGSDSLENAVKEIAFFFQGSEL